MNGLVNLRDVPGEATTAMPDVRRPRLRSAGSQLDIHFAAFVGLFEVAADRPIPSEPGVSHRGDAGVPPTHHLGLCQTVEPGRVVVEAGTAQHSLGANLERHRNRVEIPRLGRIEDQLASYGPRYVQAPHRLEMNPKSPALIRTV